MDTDEDLSSGFSALKHMKDPDVEYIYGWTLLDSFQQILYLHSLSGNLALNFLLDLGVSVFLHSLFTDPVAPQNFACNVLNNSVFK